MDIREYLYQKRLSVSEFGKMINYSRIHISAVMNGRLPPTAKMAQLIENATDGIITFDEIMSIQPKSKEKNAKECTAST